MIAVIGGEGYIGENLISYFESKSVSCQSLDKKTGFYAEKENAWLGGMDFIIMLACLPGGEACTKNPKQATIDNIMASDNIFRIASRNDIPVIFTSSLGARHPVKNYYNMTKWQAEMLAQKYNSMGGDIRILRLANVYGGSNYWEKKNTVVKRFFSEENPVINGNGEQSRDFVHILDVCKAIEYTISKGDNLKRLNSIDIGTGRPVKIKELASLFPHKKFTYKKFTYNSKSGEIGVLESKADPNPALKEIGFKAEIDVKMFITEILGGERTC